MAGRSLDIASILTKDTLGCVIANHWIEWDTRRQERKDSWEEVRRYVYATDTTTTSNSVLPWKNKTTVPKLCQIRDNLHANYMASLFPKRKWLFWEGDNEDDNTKGKVEAIENYMEWAIDRHEFEDEVSKLVLDYIDYGDCFATVEWVDNRVELPDKTQVGYVGPLPRRISPLDIVFNPVASSFTQSPKIIRSVVTMGELKRELEAMSTEHNREELEELFQYLRQIRANAGASGQTYHEKDVFFRIDGFDSFQSYLGSGYVELLTFYGDLYDSEKDILYRNHKIVVADRHKVIGNDPLPSYFGSAPIYHSGWRPRQDNIWSMGPLDNLIGLQYRVDHLENLKADVFDLIAFPPLKIKGYVEDFEWGPMERIYCGDEGDVEVLSPDVAALSANIEIDRLLNLMEVMAGAPKEAMGFRSPGEKTAYEVQRLENAASRIFQAKIKQFEAQIVEPLVNAMLELARRKMDSTTIRVFDDEYKITNFHQLSSSDITGSGRIRPLAARHFAEKAEVVQNLTNFANSPLGQDQGVRMHISGLRLAEMIEELLNIESYKLVEPYVALAEQADAQRIAQANEEQVLMEAGTPTGLTPEDSDEPFM